MAESNIRGSQSRKRGMTGLEIAIILALVLITLAAMGFIIVNMGIFRLKEKAMTQQVVLPLLEGETSRSYIKKPWTAMAVPLVREPVKFRSLLRIGVG